MTDRPTQIERDGGSPREAEALEALRAALADCAHDPWMAARFVPSDEAERGGRIIIAAARTRSWDEIDQGSPVMLRPYAVHQRTLVVGVAAPEGETNELCVDTSHFVGRAWAGAGTRPAASEQPRE